jgi:hypothetical protein
LGPGFLCGGALEAAAEAAAAFKLLDVVAVVAFKLLAAVAFKLLAAVAAADNFNFNGGRLDASIGVIVTIGVFVPAVFEVEGFGAEKDEIRGPFLTLL